MAISLGVLVTVSMSGFYFAGVSESALTVSPQNTVAVAGGAQVVLNCTSSLGSNQIGWAFSGSIPSLVSGCIVVGSSSPYSVSSSSSGNCDLIINNPITTALAGLYSCTETSSANTATSQLIILGSAPTSKTNVSSSAIESGQSILMNCSFSFTQYQNGGLLTPQVSWASPASQPVPFINATYITSELIVQATPPTVPAYTCTSSFATPSSPASGQATNAPTWTYSATFQSKTVVVPYSPNATTMNITNSTGKLLTGHATQAVGTTLICSASAYPLPSYYWTGPDGSTTGQNITLNSASVYAPYTCFASNSVGSASLSVNLTVTASGPEGPYTSACQTALIIGLCLGIGVPFLTFVILLTAYIIVNLCGYRIYCNKKDASEAIETKKAAARRTVQRDHATSQQTIRTPVVDQAAHITTATAQDPMYINEIGLSTMPNATQYESLALGNREGMAPYEPLNLARNRFNNAN